MAKFGFLSVLEEELEKHLDVDFAIDWDKKITLLRWWWF